MRSLASPILTHWRPNLLRAMSSFSSHSKTLMTVCVVSRSKTPTAIFCFSVVRGELLVFGEPSCVKPCLRCNGEYDRDPGPFLQRPLFLRDMPNKILLIED